MIKKTPDERLKYLISHMTLKHNYWGYLFARIKRVSSKEVPSIMGIAPTKDGTIQLLYQPDIIDNTDDNVIKKVLEHEGLHVLNKHISRLIRVLTNTTDEFQKINNSKIWNIAADCAVNCMMDMPKQLNINNQPWEGHFPNLYDLPDKKNTEFYYINLLMQDKKERENGNDYGITGLADGTGSHEMWGDIINDVPDTASLSRRIDGYVQEIIRDSIKNFGRDNLPSSIISLIDEALTPPKAPYYQIIKKLVKGSKYSKFKRAFSTINRKRTYVFMSGDKKGIPQISPFPGRTRDHTFDIGILIDTSGSMSNDDVKEGLSGVKNIIEKDRYCKTTIIENDTEVQKEYECKKIEDIDFEIKGRGGTVLQPGLERFKELNPDVVIAFTDGHCDNIKQMPKRMLPKKIIWVIQKEGSINSVNGTGYIVRIDD